MIKDMLECYQLSLHSNPKIHSDALNLITSLITGDCEMWRKLLKPSEMFLTEIVSNKFCNIDVDKCDYLLRDNFYVNQEIHDFCDFFKTARITKGNDGFTHIAYHVDALNLIENMFINRANYHMNVYQHPKVAGVERQVHDICLLADRAGLKIGKLPITKVQNDCSLYLQLDDSVLDLIRNSTLDNQFMSEAQKLLNYLDNEIYYKFICEFENHDDCISTLKILTGKFGDNFCMVNKKIPNADVPKNIPLYDDNGDSVERVSSQKLNYESVLIFCKALDNDDIHHNAFNFLNNNNNF